MRVAVVYNRDSKKVINLFGMANREKIGLMTIDRLVKALRSGGHEVIALEGDKDLLERLEEFMPRVVQGERPGMVFNVSYGIQGQARYTHVPSILEMAGIPYVASGPLGHSLSLDKVVTKMILKQNGIPTPDFAVLESPDAPIPEMKYPVIVKPKNEAVSFGLRVVDNAADLREAAKVIFDEFNQAVLAEQFIEGREINVGLLGNNPPEALPPVELSFGSGGPKIYTYEDKTGRSGRVIKPICPAPISEELTKKAQNLAVRAFRALGLYDCARVDMRMDKNDNLFILETNSLPSLGEHGSYLVGAAQVGLDFKKFANRLVEVASARYFGTPAPTVLDKKSIDARTHVLSYVTQRRKHMERRVKEWVDISSRTSDPLGCQQAAEHAEIQLRDLGLKPVAEFTDEPEVWTWETTSGFEGGTLFIVNLDVPRESGIPHQPYRRSGEGLYGEGVGTSRAPFVMLLYALRAVRSLRSLRNIPLGVLLHTDEGRGAQHSEDRIRAAAAKAKRVFVLSPGFPGGRVILRRRGNRKFLLRVLGAPVAPGRAAQEQVALRWTLGRLEQFAQLSSQKNQVSLSTLELKTDRFPMRLPHRVTASILMTYQDVENAEKLESKMKSILGKGGPKWKLVREMDRPPMRERPLNIKLFKELQEIAAGRDLRLKRDTSTWPSVAGLVPAKVACLCGLGPEVQERGTPDEHVIRLSLIQRTLLLAEFLAQELEKQVVAKPKKGKPENKKKRSA